MDVKGIIRSLIEEKISEATEVGKAGPAKLMSYGPKGDKVTASKIAAHLAKRANDYSGANAELVKKLSNEVAKHGDTTAKELIGKHKAIAKNVGMDVKAAHNLISGAASALKEEVITEQFNTEKGEAKEINGKKYIGLNLLWNGEKFGEVHPYRAISQTKSRGSRIATSQKTVVRWSFSVPSVKTDRYAMTNGFSSRDEAAQAALKLYRKSMTESLDEDAKADYEKVRALMPSSMPVDKWVPIKNGFEAIVSSKGSYTLRRKVKMAGEVRYEKFSLTRSGGLKSLGFSRIEESLDEGAKSLFQKIKKHAANLGDKFVQGALHGATFGMMGHDTHDPLTGNAYDNVKPFSKRIKKKKMKESLDEASDSKLDKAMAIINTRITKQGQPPKYPSFDSAPEDIKAAARNLAKNLK